MKDGQHFDVVICGGGNAGLLMARQLQLHSRPRSILVVDKGSDNAPSACHKIGESIAEGAAYHLRHTLELNDYLFGCHVPKFGFRFFFGGGETPFADRLEYGGTQWPPFATFQLDRGVFENDLRRMVTERGAIVLSEASIKTIELSNNGPHRVSFEQYGSKYTARGRWVIDATGRRRLLANKLALKSSVDHRASASWMRFDRRIDIEELVGREQIAWHNRVGPPRWFSTVHLAGAGYWVWIIPLREGRTSVGIVSDESIHPVAERGSSERMLAWCRTHEPELGRLLEGPPILDFGAMRNFGIGCSRVFSHQRWSVIGDAAVFPDPLYAFGQDLIAHGVSITALLIDLDDNGLLSESVAESYSRMFLTMFDLLLDHFRGAYPILGNPFVYSQKLAWDSSLYFAILQQSLTQNIYDRRDAAQLLMNVFERLTPLNRAMQSIFRVCHERAGPIDIYHGMRTWAPRVAQFADSSLDKYPSSALEDFFAQRLNHLEGIATAIFGNILQRSGTVAYELASSVLHTGIGLNPSAASLEPERWKNDGLFDVTRSKPDFDRPAEWDVHNRISAERARFQPIAPYFRAVANEMQERIALIEDSKNVSYGQLLGMVDRLSEKITQEPSGLATIETSSVARAALMMLAMLCAERHFALFSSQWSKEETASALAACVPALRVNDKVFEQLVRFDCRAENKNHEDMRLESDDKYREQCFFKPALRDIRFNRFGTRDVVLDHAALFRMRDWLARLIQIDLDPIFIDQPLRCVWAGPPRYEILVPLTLGCTLLVPHNREQVGTDLLTMIERCKIDLIFGEPDQLRLLVAAGWPNRQLRVVSVGDPLSDSLLRLLRDRAERVCDFGYATFAH